MTPLQSITQQTSIVELGSDIRGAFVTLFNSFPENERGPSAIARALGVNRVMVSKLLNAVRRDDPLEVVQHIPGPDSLRSITHASRMIDDVPDTVLDRTDACIERFASLIRDRFGTRGALNAAISDQNDSLRKHFDETARYDVYNGMRHVLGVEGDTWITSMIFTPNVEDEDTLSVTMIHGVLGMRRLRPDTPVRFTYGPPYEEPGPGHDPLQSDISLLEFFENKPAPLISEHHNGQLVHRLAPFRVGKNELVDMLTVSQDTRGCRRYASQDRPLGGVAIFHDVPVRLLHCDAIVHEDAFPDTTPRVIAYNPGSRGPANPNDPARDIDRIDVCETIESLGNAAARFEAPAIPNYKHMVRRVFSRIGEPPENYRVYRLTMAYPVHGFQYVLAFDAPAKP